MKNHSDEHELHAAGLPDRLAEVLIGVARGQSSKMIARELRKENGDCLSPGTVDAYRNTLRFKLDAKNTPELISKAFACGFLRYLSLALALILPIDSAWDASADSDEQIRNQARGRGRRSRRNKTSQQDSLTLDQLNSACLAFIGPVVAEWDQDSKQFLFFISERALHVHHS